MKSRFSGFSVHVWCVAVLLGVGSTSTGNAQEESPRNLRWHLERYTADLDSLQFKYRVPMSEDRAKRFEAFYVGWLNRLEALSFDTLQRDAQIDYLLLKNEIQHELASLRQDRDKDAAIADLLDFSPSIIVLLEQRERLEEIEGQPLAEKLYELHLAVQSSKAKLASRKNVNGKRRKPTHGIRAARRVRELSRSLREWYGYYEGYDPLFTWWCEQPYEQLAKDLEDYADELSRVIADLDPRDQRKIVGEPIGTEALAAELRFEMIPYSPAELIDIAKREFEWCDREMLAASKELGFGDDWRAAQEHVKDLYVEPGEQTKLIRDMAFEAVEFIEARDLLTIPSLCKETWRMEMMSPARQKVSPYFLGGPTIIVSYPTNTMSHPDKMMSMRGNNPHFSRATVQHELIPGHHLQAHMTKRHYAYREMFRTPFWIEGWALYWEMLLWDLDFPRSAEDRIGMLFWRKHRCARIIFSLSYHLERMTAEECIDYLVERVGHERNNAEAEVRRSVMGGYGPLYQAAYMLGGLQIRSLHESLVQTGKMTDREFHDTVIRQNAIPIDMVRLRLVDDELHPDYATSWRFADSKASTEDSPSSGGE